MEEEIILYLYNSAETQLQPDVLKLCFKQGKFQIGENQHARPLADGEHFCLKQMAISVEIPNERNPAPKSSLNSVPYMHQIAADPTMARLSELAQPTHIEPDISNEHALHTALDFLHMQPMVPLKLNNRANYPSPKAHAEAKFDVLDAYFKAPKIIHESSRIEPTEEETLSLVSEPENEGNILRDLGLIT